MGRLLGTDFESIFMDFGSQIGAQNRQNVGPRMHRKNDEKRRPARWPTNQSEDVQNAYTNH